MGLQGFMFFIGLYFLESSVIQRAVQRLTARESEVKLVVAGGDNGGNQVQFYFL
jgi:predicted transporter